MFYIFSLLFVGLYAKFYVYLYLKTEAINTVFNLIGALCP